MAVELNSCWANLKDIIPEQLWNCLGREFFWSQSLSISYIAEQIYLTENFKKSLRTEIWYSWISLLVSPNRVYSFSVCDTVILLVVPLELKFDLLEFRLLCKIPLTRDFSSSMHCFLFTFSHFSVSVGKYYLIFIHQGFKNIHSWSQASFLSEKISLT